MRLLFVGYRCNNACVFCAQGALREQTPETPESEIESAIATIAEGERVAFVGGEPTLFESLPAWIAAARARGASVLVQTNGRRLSAPGYAETLRDAGVSGLDVALAGSNEAMHDYHTGVPGSFRQTVTGLRRARAVGLPFSVNVVITRSNYRHLEEIARVVHALGGKAVRFAAAERLGSARANAPRVIAPKELMKAELARALELGIALGLGVVVGDRAEPESARDGFAGIGLTEPADGPA